MPRTAIKAEALANFIAETSYGEEEQETEAWKIEVDGSSSQTGSSAGVVLTSPEGTIFEYAIKFAFSASNNEAEYEAALAGLRLYIACDAQKVFLQTDSQLVAQQFQGNFEARDAGMAKYLDKIKEHDAKFEYFEVVLVPRDKNTRLDALARLGSSSMLDTEQTIMVEMLEQKSIDDAEVLTKASAEPEWFDDVKTYLKDNTLPADRARAKKVEKEKHMFVMVGGELCQRSISEPLAHCLTKAESQSILRELHEGECGNHADGKKICRLALHKGYWWPSMEDDAKEYVKRCDKCQKHAPTINIPAHDVHPILNPSLLLNGEWIFWDHSQQLSAAEKTS